MCLVFKQHVISLGIETMTKKQKEWNKISNITQLNKAKNDFVFIDSIINFHKLFLEMLDKGFQKNKYFSQSLNEAMD